MQKKLIALAVASVASGAAFAQTNVTMYGIADAGYVYSSGKANVVGGGTNTFSGIQSGLLSGSRIGFKGEEALGNGLKAIFQLEYGLDIDVNNGVGTGAVASRQQFVGLSSSSLGTVALGRQYAPGYDATARNDAFGGAAFAPQSYLTTSTAGNNTITPNNNARWNNAVTYTTPNWGGFTGKGIYSFGENAGNDRFVSTTDNGRWGVGANFGAGMFNVDALYQVRQNVVAANGKDIDEWYVGGSVDLKFLKLMASYQDQNDKNLTNNDNSTWSVGAVIPIMSSSAIHLGYAELDFDQGTKGAKLNGKSKSAAVAFSHGLSKRTTLYTGYVYTDNDKDSVAAAPAGLTNLVGAVDRKNHTFTAGIRHTF